MRKRGRRFVTFFYFRVRDVILFHLMIVCVRLHGVTMVSLPFHPPDAHPKAQIVYFLLGIYDVI